MELALECSDDEWGPADKVFKEKALSIIDPRAKRLYSDMRSSNLGHSQAGTFLSTTMLRWMWTRMLRFWKRMKTRKILKINHLGLGVAWTEV
jgi:hypothetical protein